MAAIITGHLETQPPMAQQRFCNWMVTCFDMEHFAVPDTDPNFKYMVYQVEECPETRAWHVQGYLELHRQTNLSTVLDMFPCPVHLEQRRGKRPAAIAYCTKPETRICQPTHWGDSSEPKPGQRLDLVRAAALIRAATSWNDVVNNDELFQVAARHMTWAKEIFNARPQVIPPPGITLRKWQLDALEVLDGEPVKRMILWIWSEASGTGKTTFFDYCSHKYSVLPGTDWTNTLYVYDGQRIIWFDRTRQESLSFKSGDQFYLDMERWSNHTFHTSTKYQPTRKLVRAHIVVTANTRPDLGRLPERFRIIECVPDADEESDAERPEESPSI